ncbi:MAG: ssl1498 family light-harvesting-like protein [Cyanobacteria bacterium J06641_2]
MPYTTEEGGRLNNFAKEPKVYKAEPPNKKQQITYLVLGVAAAALLGGVFYVAFSVSNAAA